MSKIAIVGVRGIPNRYGGFERLVEVLAPHLVAQGHDVTVFCAGDGHEVDDVWNGVHRRFIPAAPGARGTLAYDLAAFRAVPPQAVALIFGYGTAVYQSLLRARGIRHAVNMDGIEWQRRKWSGIAKLWLRAGEFAASRLSTELIADHPAIQADLARRLGVRSTMIAYGVDLNRPEAPAHPLLDRLGDGKYMLVIARPEPENQIHVLLDAYSRQERGMPLLVIGDFTANDYGRALIERYPSVEFFGPLYDAAVLDALRARAYFYLHGHSVGGTNPSLIEAMAAGATVVAHDNIYNRWVLGDGGLFFSGAEALSVILSEGCTEARRRSLVTAAIARCRADFMWDDILAAYAGVVDRLAAR